MLISKNIPKLAWESQDCPKIPTGPQNPVHMHPSILRFLQTYTHPSSFLHTTHTSSFLHTTHTQARFCTLHTQAHFCTLYKESSFLHTQSSFLHTQSSFLHTTHTQARFCTLHTPRRHIIHCTEIMLRWDFDVERVDIKKGERQGDTLTC